MGSQSIGLIKAWYCGNFRDRCVGVTASPHYTIQQSYDCISRPVMKTDALHYTSRMLGPMTGACGLYFLPYQVCDCLWPVLKIWNHVKSLWLEWTRESVVRLVSLCAWWRYSCVTIPVLRSCNRELCSVWKPLHRAGDALTLSMPFSCELSVWGTFFFLSKVHCY